METTTDLKSITVGQQNYKVFACLIRLWDTINMHPRYGGGLISIDGILLNENVSTFYYFLSQLINSHVLNINVIIIHVLFNASNNVHGNMAQISVPKRFEKQFRHLLAKGSVYIFGYCCYWY
jgi:hypothetical protein